MINIKKGFDDEIVKLQIKNENKNLQLLDNFKNELINLEEMLKYATKKEHKTQIEKFINAKKTEIENKEKEVINNNKNKNKNKNNQMKNMQMETEAVPQNRELFKNKLNTALSTLSNTGNVTLSNSETVSQIEEEKIDNAIENNIANVNASELTDTQKLQALQAIIADKKRKQLEGQAAALQKLAAKLKATMKSRTNSYLSAAKPMRRGYRATEGDYAMLPYDKESGYTGETFKNNLERKYNSLKNPFAAVSANYLSSIKTYAGLDDKYTFDGRYFHVVNYPKPIDKQQISALTSIVNSKILDAATVKEAKTLKMHLNIAKFLFALNKANRYLKSILVFENKYDNMKDGKLETLAKIKGQAALYFQEKTTPEGVFSNAVEQKVTDANTKNLAIKKLAYGNDTATNVEQSLSLGTAVKTYKENRKNMGAIRKGFDNAKSMTDYMSGYNKNMHDTEKVDTINRVYASITPTFNVWETSKVALGAEYGITNANATYNNQNYGMPDLLGLSDKSTRYKKPTRGLTNQQILEGDYGYQ